MKFIVRLFGFLLALAAVLAALAFLLPKEHHIERSLQIDAPVAVIQPFLSTPKKFNQWSPWAAIDPNTRFSYAGPDTGVGSKISWYSENREVGSGTQEVKAVSDERVDIYLDFGSKGDANVHYLLEPNETGTKVTWAFDTDLGNNPINRWFGMMLEEQVGDKYVEGLQNLNREAKKAYEEEQLKQAVAIGPYIEPVLEMAEVTASSIAFVRGSSSSDTEAIGPALAEAYGKLMAAITEQELEMEGPPLAINDNYDEESDVYSFRAAIPVEASEDLELGDGIEFGETYAGSVIQATHTGSYAGLPTTYERIEAYMQDNALVKNGSSWEQYVTDPTTVAPEEIVTIIYWPVAAGEIGDVENDDPEIDDAEIDDTEIGDTE